MTTSGTKSLNFNLNTFSFNAAITGGSIFCDGCNWVLINNVFEYGVSNKELVFKLKILLIVTLLLLTMPFKVVVVSIT